MPHAAARPVEPALPGGPLLSTRSLCGFALLAGGYLLAAGLACGIVGVVLRLWDQDLHIPLSEGGDGLLYLTWLRTVIDEGWYLSNSRLGAPGAMHLGDFPQVEGLHFLVVKLLGLAGADASLAYNLFYLLTFPLATLTSLFVLRQLGITYLPALVASLLYAFLPYHFHRIGHLFLSAYYLVPLLVLLLIRLHRGDTQPRTLWQGLGCVLVCSLISSGGVYYAFFACFFLLVVGAQACLARRRPGPLLGALALVGLITAGVLANLAPHLHFQYHNGTNPTAVLRGPDMAERFALKPAQLILPISGHRISRLARFKHHYNGTAPLVNENDSVSLGIIGSAGFLFLVGYTFWWCRSSACPTLLDTLALLTCAGLALAVVGGGGTLFSYLISDKIRAFNRICVYLAFFSLATVAIGLDQIARRGPVAVWRVILVCLLVVGLVDQTSATFLPSQGRETRFREDARYFADIEERLPVGSMIFQLPHVPYPEAGSIHQLEDHEHLRAYLHTRTLRFSHGAMKGRATDRWLDNVATAVPARMVDQIRDAGFAGILLDRRGYPDGARQLEGALRSLLGAPLESVDGRLLFFDATASAIPPGRDTMAGAPPQD